MPASFKVALERFCSGETQVSYLGEPSRSMPIKQDHVTNGDTNKGDTRLNFQSMIEAGSVHSLCGAIP
jgi:hypothetical protein